MSDVHFGRIGALRSMMAAKGWDAVVIPDSDPHGSEYPAPRWRQVEWLSGFTGESGQMVVTMDHAGLWTDSRYFIQAVKELEGSGVTLHKTGVPGSETMLEWLSGHAATVATDGSCMPRLSAERIRSSVKVLYDVPDLLDAIWDGRPGIPQTTVITLDDETTGESRLQKIAWLRKFLMEKECDCILISALDEIAWLLNVRGQDIEYNPYVISYLLVTMDDVLWYMDKGDGTYDDPDTEDSLAEIQADGIRICRYDGVLDGPDSLIAVSQDAPRIYCDPASLNYDIYRLIASVFHEEDIFTGQSPVVLRKAVKNGAEISGMKEAFLADGVAMEKFLYWLEHAGRSGRTVTEWDASVRLTSLRAGIPGYKSDSFKNISAYGSNAALPHYSTPEEGSAVIKPYGLYLTDSGGQYIFGTTDITRTVPMGECSELEKEDYTLVLRGMIDLAMAVFPKGTPGCRLDVLARNPLWQSRRNFGHGTGHGVGFYLGVHEGPQDIRQNLNSQPLLPGMVTSDEPGIYREGQHGVRHENILLCVESGDNTFGDWLGFETLTLCHIDTSALILSLMTEQEKAWLDGYNRHVYETLSPELDSETAGWLRLKTLPVGR